MRRPAIFALSAAAVLLAGNPDGWAAEGAATAGCSSEFENLDRLPDCMKVGRRVRVESSVSRGTATLNGGSLGMMPAAVHGGASDAFPPRGGRVRVPAGAGQSLWSGFFAR